MLGGKKTSRRAFWLVLFMMLIMIGIILLSTGYSKNSEEHTDQYNNLIIAGWILSSISFVFFWLSFKG
jgi:hypothetical protein